MLCRDRAGRLVLVLVRPMLQRLVEVLELAATGAVLVLVDVLVASEFMKDSVVGWAAGRINA